MKKSHLSGMSAREFRSGAGCPDESRTSRSQFLTAHLQEASNFNGSGHFSLASGNGINGTTPSLFFIYFNILHILLYVTLVSKVYIIYII